MKITFITLFPKYYDPFISESIIEKAIKKELLEVKVIDFRSFSNDKHHKVDDTIYGGGQGMLLMVEPIHKALKKTKGKKILLSPQGKTFTQKKALELSKLDEITFVAGRYEGFDERVRSLVDEEISIGDYVLTGGEIPSMVIADSIVRLIPGVIKEKSHLNDSFQNNLLDYPQYTRPREYLNMKVPEVLLNGDHSKINAWRRDMQVKKTKQVKPELIERKHNEK